MADDEKHPFLTRADVDNLTAAVRALNMTMAAIRLEQSKHHQQMLLAMQSIASNTANLPALMDVLMGQKTNGDVHDVADRDNT